MLQNRPSPRIIWSNTRIFINSPASFSFLVISISALLGSTSPLGWLWKAIIAPALFCNAAAKTSLGRTSASSRLPTLMMWMPVILFLRFRNMIPNFSTGSEERARKSSRVLKQTRGLQTSLKRSSIIYWGGRIKDNRWIIISIKTIHSFHSKAYKNFSAPILSV